MLLSGSSHSTASTNVTSGPLDRRTGLPSSASIASNLTASPSTSGFRSFFRKNSSTPLGSPLLGPTPSLEALRIVCMWLPNVVQSPG